jgi:putative spermidine/putrescine transport system permease protein
LGAGPWRSFWHVVLPIILPGVIGIALFGFSLSYDEFPRTMMTAGEHNTLPLEIFAMTANVTTPVIYALGTLTTMVSALVIVVAITTTVIIRRRRLAR